MNDPSGERTGKIRTHSVIRATCYLLALSVCPSASLAQQLDLDALYAQAAAEGEVSAYLQGPPQVYAGFVREFEAKYPKIKVRITPGRYDLMPKIDAQIAAGKMDADLAILQTTQDYVRWRRQGVLQRFAPPGFDLIRATLKDPQAHYVPVFLVMIGFAYNPAQIPEADAPRTIPDFLKPAFRGKIVSTYPHDDDLTLYSNTLIVEKYGWEMIEKLLKQDMRFVRSHVLVSQETEKGERPVTFDQISQFNKVKFVVPDDLPMPVYPITAGIFANARIPTLRNCSSHLRSRESNSNVSPRLVPYQCGRMSNLQPASSHCRITGLPTDISRSFPTRSTPRSCAKDLKVISARPKGLTSALLLILRRNRRA